MSFRCDLLNLIFQAVNFIAVSFAGSSQEWRASLPSSLLSSFPPSSFLSSHIHRGYEKWILKFYYIPGTRLGGKPMRTGLVLAPGKVTVLGKDTEQGAMDSVWVAGGEWRGVGFPRKDGIFLKIWRNYTECRGRATPARGRGECRGTEAIL